LPHSFSLDEEERHIADGAHDQASVGAYDGPDEEEEADTMGKTQHEEGEEPEFEEEETGGRGFDNGTVPEDGGDTFEDNGVYFLFIFSNS